MVILDKLFLCKMCQSKGRETPMRRIAGMDYYECPICDRGTA